MAIQDCPQCQLPTDEGAAFCGNCGQQLDLTAAPSSRQGASSLAIAAAQQLPPYARTTRAMHAGDIKAVLSVAAGCVGIIGAVIPIAGLAFGLTGVVLGSVTRRRHKKLAMAGLIVSSIAILASLGVMVLLVSQT